MYHSTMEKSKGFGVSKLTDNDAITDSTDLFKLPFIDRTIQSGKTVIVRPTSDNSDGPFVFHVKPQGIDGYVQLNTIKLVGTCKLLKTSDQSAYTKTELAGKCLGSNNYFCNLFKSVEVSVNGERVSDSNNLYPFKVYMETVLSYGTDSGKTHLTPQMFMMDTPGKYEDLDNPNGLKRSERLISGKECDFMIPISADFLQSDRLLFPTSELIITLTRHKDSFGLITDVTLKEKINVVLSNLQLHVRYISLNPKLAEEHVLTIRDGPAFYPIIRTDMKSFGVPSQTTNYIFQDLFHDVVPNNIIVGMIDTKAYYGDATKNPFNFQHFNVQEMFFRVKNTQVPAIPIRPDFSENRFQRDYYNLLANTGVSSNSDFGNMITPEQYAGGCFFAAVDLSGPMDNMLRQREVQSGTVDLHVTFAFPLQQGTTFIIYSSGNAIVEIYSDKKVIVNPQPSTL